MSKLNNKLVHSIIRHENHKKGNDAIHGLQVNKRKTIREKKKKKAFNSNF